LFDGQRRFLAALEVEEPEQERLAAFIRVDVHLQSCEVAAIRRPRQPLVALRWPERALLAGDRIEDANGGGSSLCAERPSATQAWRQRIVPTATGLGDHDYRDQDRHEALSPNEASRPGGTAPRLLAKVLA